MTKTQWLLTVTVTALGLALAGGRAGAAEAEATKPGGAEPAVAKQNFVNVRARAAINSEVVARLMKGQTVLVSEEVTLSKPKADEPAQWCRIALPTNASTWVHADYIDSNKTVRPKLLNVRGGPGENYGVLGRIEKGTAVKILDEKGHWLKIEPPAGASGFVAAHLLLKGAGTVAVAAPPKEAATTNVTVVPPVVAEVKTNEAPTVTITEVTNVVPAVATNEVVMATNPPVVVAVAPNTNVSAAPVGAPVIINVPAGGLTDTNPPPVPPIELVKRVITREGLLKSAANIQAPSHFELRSLENNRLIDYVWSPSTNIVLKDYKGKKVLVTGEELLDERWPHTPVITVDEITLAP
jgi:uncharacterized protein YgiM (DUF1202 family)